MSLEMDTAVRTAETRFLETMRSQYEGEGYKFVVHPEPSELPSFFSSYQPDAIATKADRKIAIEVKSRANVAGQGSIQRIRAIFEGHPDWQLTVAYMGTEASLAKRLPVADRASILGRVAEVGELAAKGHERAAFLVAWGLLEAALNTVQPHSDKRPRTPGTVVETLGMYGYVSSDVEKSLRSLIDLRNRIVHGDLTIEPAQEDVMRVLEAVTSALEEA